MADSIIKRAEIAVRKMFNSYFYRNRKTELVAVPTRCFELGPGSKVLLLRQDRIGDALITAPILRALKQKHPMVEFHILLSSNNVAAKHCLAPYISQVVLFEKGLWGLWKLRREMRRTRYQVVVDLMDNASSTSSMIIGASAAPFSVGVDKENRGAYSHVVPLADKQHVHIVDRLSALLLPFGIDPATTVLDLEYQLSDEDIASARLAVSADVSVKNIGINLTGADDSRTLSEEQVVAAIEAYRTKYDGCNIHLFAAPQHREMIKRLAKKTATIGVSPSNSFHEFACRISLMDEILTPDTSVVHLAAAWKIPCVVLYVQLRTDLMPWFPYHSPHRALITNQPQVASITLEELEQAIASL